MLLNALKSFAAVNPSSHLLNSIRLGRSLHTRSGFLNLISKPLQLSQRPRAPTPSRCFSILSNFRKTPSPFRDSRYFLSHQAAPPPLPPLSPPAVGIWLMASSSLVLAVIVVGGVTRLTESGLSITEWNPITGILPPLTQAQWEAEFEKYKATPEFKLMNMAITLHNFKKIFYMEWGHRVLGRIIGIAFVGPLIYFAFKRQLTPAMPLKLGALGLLIGAQGLLGWYMVKSGLDNALMDIPGAVPRVSQYRLASHLGLAFVLYIGMFWTGLSVLRDWKYAHGANWNGESKWRKVISTRPFKVFSVQAWALAALVFVTAISGAFVAGLDAGLLYNEFPYMGGRLAPPRDELFSPAYSQKQDRSDLWWRNMLENPTTVQFDHRVLATTTYICTGLLFAQTRLIPAMRAALPSAITRGVTAAFAMANVQFLLGIATLISLVPVPLAAAHQAGSVLLLSAMVHVLVTLRRPGRAAQFWRENIQKLKKR